MRLLVSVANGSEASAARAGGADIIDAKNPLAGALGAVSSTTLREIHATIGGTRLVTAALGDTADEKTIERTARSFTTLGASFVKCGFAGIDSASRISGLTAAAVRGALAGSDGRSGVVAVAFADARRETGLTSAAFIDAAAFGGAQGVLIDTVDKNGPGLRELVTPDELAAWVTNAHEAGLFAAVAGKLSAKDLPFVLAAGADIAGVRGAVCKGGRNGSVSAESVRILHALCRPSIETSHTASGRLILN